MLGLLLLWPDGLGGGDGGGGVLFAHMRLWGEGAWGEGGAGVLMPSG